jgi:hypothetical protein
VQAEARHSDVQLSSPKEALRPTQEVRRLSSCCPLLWPESALEMREEGLGNIQDSDKMLQALKITILSVCIS